MGMGLAPLGSFQTWDQCPSTVKSKLSMAFLLYPAVTLVFMTGVHDWCPWHSSIPYSDSCVHDIPSVPCSDNCVYYSLKHTFRQSCVCQLLSLMMLQSNLFLLLKDIVYKIINPNAMTTPLEKANLKDTGVCMYPAPDILRLLFI